MLKTNRDKLVITSVSGEVVHPTAIQNYSVDFDGNPKVGLGMSGIKNNISLGDPCFGWEEGEHIEPGLSISNKNPRENAALGVLACIGNRVKVVSGDAKGAMGYIIGKHGNFMVYLKKEGQEKINIGDKIQVKAWGSGLKIEGFEDVCVNKISPDLLENMGILVKDGKLKVPVVADFPAYIMGSGYGMWPPIVDYDIQTTCPDVFDELGLKKLRFGDIVLLRDQLNCWGRGYYKDAITIGIIIHGWSYHAGHGPGVTTILSTKSGNIEYTIDEYANIAYYLGVKEKI